jgi:site-specific recombinase XerD
VPKGSEAPANKVPKAAAAKSNSNKQATPPLNAANAAAMAQYIQHLQLHSYSPSTIRTYQNELMQFFQTLGKHEARELPPSRLQDYLHWCHTTLQLSENTIHSRLNAMKYYYEQVLGKEKWFWEIPRPKKVEQLPKVISEEKIIEGLFSVEKLKHKVLLLVAYSAGLRVGEVVRLRICDIDSDRMQIKILAGKGKKDRVVPLSKHLLPLLRTFYTTYKPKYWLFEGEKTNEHYSTRSAQILFKQAFAKLNLPPNISFHSLRHSFATHLLDGGTDISYIQKILGHNDIKTTLIYAKVTNKDLAKIESPLDKMMNKKTP